MSNERVTKIFKNKKEFHMKLNKDMSVEEFKEQFSSYYEDSIEDYDLFNENGERINSTLNELNVIYLRKSEKKNSSKNSSEDIKNRSLENQRIYNNNNNFIFPKNKVTDSGKILTPGNTQTDGGETICPDENTPPNDKKNDETKEIQQTSNNALNEEAETNTNNKDKLNSEKNKIECENNGAEIEKNKISGKKENENPNDCNENRINNKRNQEENKKVKIINENDEKESSEKKNNFDDENNIKDLLEKKNKCEKNENRKTVRENVNEKDNVKDELKRNEVECEDKK